jgi:hypothetical protein
MTGDDRQHAQNYTEGDVIRYTKGSKPLGIEAGEYARGVTGLSSSVARRTTGNV